jgi:hypothetical protein
MLWSVVGCGRQHLSFCCLFRKSHAKCGAKCGAQNCSIGQNIVISTTYVGVRETSRSAARYRSPMTEALDDGRPGRTTPLSAVSTPMTTRRRVNGDPQLDGDQPSTGHRGSCLTMSGQATVHLCAFTPRQLHKRGLNARSDRRGRA